MPRDRAKPVLAILVVLALLALIVLPFVGRPSGGLPGFTISLADLFDKHSPNYTIFWDLRLPRTLAAFTGGAVLSLAGLAFQAYFRNWLATPYTLGVSSGAAFGASLYVVLGGLWTFGPFSGTTLFAGIGALLAVALVYVITLARRSTSAMTMLLGGIAVNFLFSSLILLVQVLASNNESTRILRWLMGGVDDATMGEWWRMLPIILPIMLLFFTRLNELNLLSIGEEFAVSRGVSLRLTRNLFFGGGSLMTAAVVAVCGPVGFVGIVCPHICRLLLGADHRRLAPASVLFGGAFLAFCDTIARTALPYTQLPLGIITSLIGVPFFIWLLCRTGSEGTLS
jgi:iron complex transport system permease protein